MYTLQAVKANTEILIVLHVDDAVYLSPPTEDHLRIIHIDKLWTNPKYDCYVVYFTLLFSFQFLVPVHLIYGVIVKVILPATSNRTES